MNQKKNVVSSYFKKSIIPSLLLFLIGWGASFLISKLIWKNDLKPISPAQLFLAISIPVLLIICGWLSINKSNGKTFNFQFFFIVLLLVSIVNILLVHFLHIQIFGDFDQLPTDISNSVIFPRWLIGSSILNFIYHSVIQPIRSSFQTAAFVRLGGSLLMLGFSIFLLIKYPNRLNVILPLLSPIWFLFSSGYNEYYPFIAEIYLIFLIILSNDYLSRIPPIFIGIIASLMMLFYVGFVPVGLFLILVLFLKKGLKPGFVAAIAALGSSVLFILIFWPDSFISFFPAYYSSLNIKSSDLYPGLLMAHLPFFNFSYAFSGENLNRIFNEYHWAGGFASVAILFFVLLKKNFLTKEILLKKNVLYLLIFFVWQIFYFIFMVPRLGAYQDIDLFFTVYLIITFIAGDFADLSTDSNQNADSSLIKHRVVSFFLGNSSFLILYFCFIGIPYFK